MPKVHAFELGKGKKSPFSSREKVALKRMRGLKRSESGRNT